MKNYFTLSSTIKDVLNDEHLKDFARLLFPIDLNTPEHLTLAEISSSKYFIWYTNIKAEKTVEILNYLKDEVINGHQVYYQIYTNSQIKQDVSKSNVGLFYFRGKAFEKFALMCAGGGFMYVASMHDSFPHALYASQKGHNSFALIYRVDRPYEDCVQAIHYIMDHSDLLHVNKLDYSLWGGSAGARIAAICGNKNVFKRLSNREDIEKASAVILQYTGYSNVSINDAPTYACCGTQDGIASYLEMNQRHLELKKLGINSEFHAYNGLGHGFGIGTDTIAKDWILDALKFWEAQIKKP